MSLKSLAFVAIPKAIHDPKMIRRQRLIARLEEQRMLAKDPTFSPSVKRWKRAEDGSRSVEERFRHLKPWWTTDASGQVFLTVRVGLKTIEFDKGKTGVVVGAVERLDSVLQTLIAATTAGELDAALNASTGAKKRNAKAA